MSPLRGPIGKLDNPLRSAKELLDSHLVKIATTQLATIFVVYAYVPEIKVVPVGQVLIIDIDQSGKLLTTTL